MSNELVRRADMRQSNMELLRIIAIFGVILLHYNVAEMGNAFELVAIKNNSLLLHGLEAFYAWPVDAFMMLSGYFMCMKKCVDIKKPVLLVVEVVFFQLVFALTGYITGSSSLAVKELLLKLIPTNYFVVLYLAVYIISPYVNSFLEGLTAERRRKLLLLLFAVFSLYPYALELLERYTMYPLEQASTISSTGTQNGYNITNFLLCYSLGAGLRTRTIKIKKPKLVFAVATLCIMYTAFLFGIYAAVEYCSPFVIIQAASLICVFERINIGRSRVINKLAEASFTVYLAHGCFYSFCMIERFVYARVWVLLAHVVLCQIGMYLVCFAIFLVYDAITKPLFKLLWSKVKAPEINLETAKA